MSENYSFHDIFRQMNEPLNSTERREEVDEEVDEETDENKRQNATALDGTRLIPVSELPLRYRQVFINRFPHFNCVQSKVFKDVFYSNKSIAICAPTSSGKTVIFELAIVKKLKDLEESNQSVSCLKCVYMAPLKKLVDEKYNEFRNAFDKLGLNCVQFTGDSEMDDYEKLTNANIVLTTPEKWDSMVRGNQNFSLIRTIQLMFIDEIHSIGDDQRGATMEAVISRMKTLRTVQMQSGSESKIRFIAASATSPNVEDIAHWLDPIDSIGYNLSADYRPVRIQILVMGYYCANDVTDFKFDINLSYKLDSVIRSHCDSKPTLVFCSTRKSVEMTAKTLTNSNHNFFNSLVQRNKLETILQRCDFKDKKLMVYMKRGIAYHHSGLDRKDKQIVEKLFVDCLIPVLISTTTLSMGVNLPAHLVVIKNTTQFESNGVVREYPETLIMQMIGRAGRPQFDSSAVAVIMTKNDKRIKYEMLSTGSLEIESRLHFHLIEHLNAEIALRTITSIDIAVDWIRSTFLYIRLIQNPKHYQKSVTNIEQGLEVGREWCHNELSKLKDAEMIATDESFTQISSTALGRFMARHYISFDTMKKFCQMIAKDLELKDIIEEISKCVELTQESQIRVSEKKTLNEMNQKKIRFPIDGKMKTSDNKINCLIQTTFGSEISNITDNTLIQESTRMIRTGQRLSKCLSEMTYFKAEQNLTKLSFNTVLNSIILSKCFKAKLWPDSRQLTKQFNRIGDKISMKISEKYENFQQLRVADARDVEYRADRRPPFGTQLIDWVKRLPYYSLTISQNINELKRNKIYIKIAVKLENFEELKAKTPLYKSHCCYIVVGGDGNQLFCCQQLFDTKLLKNNGFYQTKDIVIESNDSLTYISAHLISDSLVGLDVESKLTLVFAADTNVTPELIPANCSTAFSNVSCEPNSRLDSVKGRCQHKCVNRISCRHNCCKKGLNSGQTQTTTESQKQVTKTKRQSNGEQNCSKKLKQNNSEDQKKIQTNLTDYYKKCSKPSVTVKNEPNIKTESPYFTQKYAEIPDNDNEYNVFDDDLQLESIDLQNNVKEDIDDGFDDEFDANFEKEFEDIINGFISEDFQRFDNKSNLKVETIQNTQNSLNRECTLTMNTMSEFSLNNQWSLFVPTTQLEGKTIFTRK